VTVLAIIGIIWGALMLLGSLINAVQLAGVSFGPENPIAKAMHDDRTLLTWSIIGVPVALTQGILLLFGSIQSLSLKRLGRSFLIAFAWFAIVFTILSAIISATVVMPRMNQIVQNSNLDALTKSMFSVGKTIGLVFSFVWLIFPALILYYMSRPHVKEAFQRGLVAPAQS
jgi:hypothetical protein